MARPLASRWRFLRTLLAGVPMVPGAPALRAVSSHAAQRTPPLQTGPWRTLFDGNTLTGWHTNPTPIEHGTGGHWQVDRGTLTGEQDPPGSGYGGILLTDSLFADFEVQVDIKPDWGVDTGLLLRCNDKRECKSCQQSRQTQIGDVVRDSIRLQCECFRVVHEVGWVAFCHPCNARD